MRSSGAITHSSLSGTIPDSVKPKLSGSLEALFNKGVTRGSSNVGLPTFNTYGNIDDAKLAVRTALKDIAGQSGKKADKELGKIGDSALARTVQDRFVNLTGPEKKELKSQLHYAVGKRVGTAEDRLINRSAVMSAFAQGASLADTKLLRTYLDGASKTDRQQALDALKQPGANAATVISRLVHADAGGSIAVFTKPLTDEQVGRLDSHLMKVDANASMFAPARFDDDYPGKAGDFVNNNLERLRIDDIYSDEGRSAVAEFATISVYTGSEGFRDINNDLRACRGRLDDLDDGTRLFASAAVKGLARLPDFEGVVVRGVNFEEAGAREHFLAGYEVGGTVTEHAFTSTGADKEFEGNVQFVIESRHGKEVTELSQKGGMDGREILFQPGTRFEVLAKAHDEASDTHFIVMKEVD